MRSRRHATATNESGRVLTIEAAKGTSVSVRRCPPKTADRRRRAEELEELRLSRARAQELQDVVVRAVASSLSPVPIDAASDDASENDSEYTERRAAPVTPADISANDEALAENDRLIESAVREATSSIATAAAIHQSLARSSGTVVAPLPPTRILRVPEAAALASIDPAPGTYSRRVARTAVVAAAASADEALRGVEPAIRSAARTFEQYREGSARAEDILRLQELRTRSSAPAEIKQQLAGAHAASASAHATLELALRDRADLLREREVLLRRLENDDTPNTTPDDETDTPNTTPDDETDDTPADTAPRTMQPSLAF